MIQTLIGREADLNYIRTNTAAGHCCSLVATSNMGKSAVLRHLGGQPPAAGAPTFIYIDCNQMAERSARALLTVIWRAISPRLAAAVPDPETAAYMRGWTDELLRSSQAVAAGAAFEDGLALALARLSHPLVLCLDEFDQVDRHLEPHAFLNLRAWHDLYYPDLVYLTATERELGPVAESREQGEFYELLSSHVRYLSLWNQADTTLFCREFAARQRLVIRDADPAYIFEQAGGHPGLTQAVCYAVGRRSAAGTRRKETGPAPTLPSAAALAGEVNVRSECAKIWDDLDPDEQKALVDLGTADHDGAAVAMLERMSLVHDSGGRLSVFSPLFADFVREMHSGEPASASRIVVDADAGKVWLDGREITSLSDLEYKLLLFLYGRLDRVCDKYSIVKGVWGEEYIDRVDDTRIEKLISRVRQKIEPDPSHPRYLQSLRGRGYKLVP